MILPLCSWQSTTARHRGNTEKKFMFNWNSIYNYCQFFSSLTLISNRLLDHHLWIIRLYKIYKHLAGFLNKMWKKCFMRFFKYIDGIVAALFSRIDITKICWKSDFFRLVFHLVKNTLCRLQIYVLRSRIYNEKEILYL